MPAWFLGSRPGNIGKSGDLRPESAKCFCVVEPKNVTCFRVVGFRGLGFRCLGFRVWGGIFKAGSYQVGTLT